MSEPLGFVDLFLFVVLPYGAVLVMVAGTIERYRRHAFSCSSHSSQFLENRLHFWGEMPFHYGILLVLLAHLVMIVVPRQVLAWTSAPRRLFILEAIALALGLLAAIGLVAIVVRRALTPAVRRVTGPLDWVVYALLLVSVGSGVAVAVLHPWGSSWFAAALTPYLWSLVRFQPDAGVIAAMPLLVKVHVVSAFAIAAIFPFSRLVHIVAVPNSYLWRRPQVVRWRRARPVRGTTL